MESYSYNGNQRLSRNNIWNEARGVDHNETSYYLYGGRGSVTANTWYNGMVASVYQYDPYGQVTYGSTECTDFYGYNAESYNPNTGLEYLRAKYYNAESGRFFQEDTYLGDLWEPLTLNRYAYVGNSPLNYMDPTGHRSVRNPLGNTLIQTPDAGKIKINVPDYLGTDSVSTQVGGTASAELTGLPVVIGEEFNEVTYNGETYYGTTHLTGASVSLSPIEVHAGISKSQTQYSINVLEKAEDFIWSTIRD